MEAVFPVRGRRWRRQESRLRHRTTPVTFAEIKEVDEEKENDEACGASVGNVANEMERRPELEREFEEFRRRRARREEHNGSAATAVGLTGTTTSSAAESPNAAPS